MHKKAKNICENLQSFPTRERGLKCYSISINCLLDPVVPHAGTWIEIALYRYHMTIYASFPTRERGLKYVLESELGLNSDRRSPRGNVD